MTNARESGTAVAQSECQECGYLGKPGQEFHSYESCILYMLDTNKHRLRQKHRDYVWSAGLRAMRERVTREEVPKW